MAFGKKKDRGDLTPPYAGHQTFVSVLARLREHGIPANIDTSEEIKGALKDSTYTQLTRSLRYLGLVNFDGEPEESLRQLVDADEEQYPQLLREVLESSYGFLFSPDKDPLDLTNASFKELWSRFERQGISGSTLRRSVFFFVQLATDAGILLAVKDTGEQLSMDQELIAPDISNNPLVIQANIVNGGNAAIPSNGQPKSLSTGELLLSRIPEYDRTWLSEDKTKWLDSFNVIVHIVEREKKLGAQ